MTRATTRSTHSVEHIWGLMADVERWGELLPTVTSVRRLGGPDPTGVGSRFEVRQPGLPAAVYDVTVWRPLEGFTWSLAPRGWSARRPTRSRRPRVGQCWICGSSGPGCSRRWSGCSRRGRRSVISTARPRRSRADLGRDDRPVIGSRTPPTLAVARPDRGRG